MSTHHFGRVSDNGYHDLAAEDFLPPAVSQSQETSREALAVIELLQRSVLIAQKLLERLDLVNSRLAERLGPDPLPEDLCDLPSIQLEQEEQETENWKEDESSGEVEEATTTGTTIQQRDLAQALKAVIKAAGRNAASPIHRHVFIEASGSRVQLSCTNGALTMRQGIAAWSDSSWDALVPAKELYEAVRRLEGQLRLTIREQQLELRAGTAVMRFPILQGGELLALPEPESLVLSLTASALRTALRQVLPCAETAKGWQSTSYCHGVYVHETGAELAFVATDGYRLACKSIPRLGTPGDAKLLIPTEACQVLKDLLPDASELPLPFSRAEDQVLIEIPQHKTGQRIVRTQGATVLVAKLIDLKYPDYQRVLPKTSASVVLSRDATLDVCKRIMAHCRLAKEHPVAMLSFTAGQVAFVTDDELACEALDAVLEGKETRIKLNLGYLRDCLQELRSERFQLAWDNPTSPLTVTGPADKGLLWVVMPVRMD